MQKRKFDELISYFNRKVADMGIDTNYKMELLGMVTALGYAHEKETEERKKGQWIPQDFNKHEGMISTAIYCLPKCSECGWQMIDDVLESPNIVGFQYCPNCGADMREPEDDIPMEYFESGGR